MSMNVPQNESTAMADVLGALLAATRIVITAHELPDGDAVGSCLALRSFLKAKGKDPVVVLPVADIGAASILEDVACVTDVNDFDFSRRPDLFVCLDCSDPSRLCDKRFAEWIGQVPTVNIDHHGKELFGNFNYVIVDASSTGELVFNLFAAAGLQPARAAAEAIWCALVTDTRRFSLASTKASTLRCAAVLLESGARSAWLNDAIFMQEPKNVFELRARATRSLELWCDDKVAAISLHSGDFADTGCRKKDADEFPEIPRGIKGTSVALYFYPYPETKPEVTKVSIRSREGAPLSAREIAAHFGGAGHADSAGAKFPGTVDEAVKSFRAFLESVFTV